MIVASVMLVLAMSIVLLVLICVQLEKRRISARLIASANRVVRNKEINLDGWGEYIDKTGKENGSKNSPCNENKNLCDYVDEIKNMALDRDKSAEFRIIKPKKMGR